MSVVTLVQCEMCSESFRVIPHERVHWNTPETWLTLIEGNPQTKEPWHFCSHACLSAWLARRTLSDQTCFSEEVNGALDTARKNLSYQVAGEMQILESEYPHLRFPWHVILGAAPREEEPRV